MKRESKSASKSTPLLLFVFLSLLAGCADSKWPTWLTGEPGDDVLNAPRSVSRPASVNDKSWPSLADVPTLKPVFTNPENRYEETEDLLSDNLKAKAARERLRNIPMPAPLSGADATPEQIEEEAEPNAASLPAPLLDEGADVLSSSATPEANEAMLPEADRPFSALLP